MSDSFNSNWQEYVVSYLHKAPESDVWSQTLTQLTLTKVEGGVGYFSCPSTGVKTVVINKQGQLASILSAITQSPVFSIYCEVVGKKVTKVEKKVTKPVTKK